MEYAPENLQPRERYKLLTGFVLPRPIAWITTMGPTGVVNAAPFSFFNVFAEDPPLIMVAINKRPDGRLKDSWANIQRTGEFVVNLTDEPLARAMHDSSGDFPPDIGEPDYLGLELAPSVDIKPPRLADAPWAMECRTWSWDRPGRARLPAMREGRASSRDAPAQSCASSSAHVSGNPSDARWLRPATWMATVFPTSLSEPPMRRACIPAGRVP